MTPRHNPSPPDFIKLRKRSALYQTTGNSKTRRQFSHRTARLAALAVLVTLATVSFFYSGSSASSSYKDSHAAQPGSLSKGLALPAKKFASPLHSISDAALPQQTAFALRSDALFPAILLQSPTVIETFAEAAHNTLQGDFELGDTVYVKAAVPDGILAKRRIVFVDPAGYIRQVSDVTNAVQEDQFTIPTTQTSVVGGSTLGNIGTWRASIISSRGVLVTLAAFSVGDPADALADLSVNNTVSPANSLVPAGFEGTFDITIANSGPSDAQDVELSDVLPANTTFVSMAQTSGPAFDCAAPENGVVKCTIASLAKRTGASFIFTYSVNAGTPVGTLIANTASITSATNELNGSDNSSTARASVVGGAGASCSLDCPEDISVNANTTVDGQPGRFVTFAGASPNGDCGTITSSPASGSFFPVGTTTVTSTSGLGGGSCTFTVTVNGTSPVTISCPANKVVTAPSGSCEAVVDPGTPTTTGTGVTVEGARNDGQALDAAFPGGTTVITWTATDANGNVATCTQTVTVNASATDTVAPTITAPADITVFTGAESAVACGAIIGESQMGSAEADDNGCAVTVARTGVPAGNLFPVGTTTVTYTATDLAGLTASDTQVITVVDNTPPVIRAPADAAYTCPSEVPAAHPGQATGAPPEELPNEGGGGGPGILGPPSDNCGTPLVTVSETSTGVGSAASPKIITRVFTATDAAGNSSSAVQTITVTDPVAPTISCPADIVAFLPLHTPDVSMAVSYPAATASDNCTTPTVTYSQASGSVFPVGTTTVTATATDWAGNSSSCSFTVTVLYVFTGYFSPVDNLPTLNQVNAGRAIPVKFSLSGNKGLNIFAPNNPSSGVIPCGANDPIVDITETVTAGGSSLSYNATNEQYNYVWKTESSWAGTCRQLVMQLNDGSIHRANFKFK
jgi:uncharacterized repeat protein (TIGR01451 family)